MLFEHSARRETLTTACNLPLELQSRSVRLQKFVWEETLVTKYFESNSIVLESSDILDAVASYGSMNHVIGWYGMVWCGIGVSTYIQSPMSNKCCTRAP